MTMTGTSIIAGPVIAAVNHCPSQVCPTQSLPHTAIARAAIDQAATAGAVIAGAGVAGGKRWANGARKTQFLEIAHSQFCARINPDLSPHKIHLLN